jgi:Bacterial protein of unknown function (DUF937)
MAINLISDVMKMATPSLINNIASALGVNPTLAQTVLASAVPAVFSGVAAQAASPSGLSNIVNSLSQMNPNMLSSLTAPMTGGANNPMITAGTSMLTSMLGAGGLSNIVNSITKSSGVPAAAGTGLVALAGQMAMSTLASHTSGMDASSIGKMLSAQAGNFSAAMPAGMSASMGNMGSTASAAAKNTANQAASAASGGTNWLKYALPALAVAAGLYYFTGMKSHDKDDMAKPAATAEVAKPAVPAAPAAIMIDNVDVTKSLTTSFSGLTAALTSVKDATSATAAAAQITEASKGISAVSALASKFSPEQKASVIGLVNGSMPALTGVITQVEALPGVGDILKPLIGPVLEQLTALTK